jgi:hypothetical protein
MRLNPRVDKVMSGTLGIDMPNDVYPSGTEPRVGRGNHKASSALTAGFFHAVIGEMLLQGFTPDEIGKVGGGNFCVFGKATAGHSSDVGQRRGYLTNS